MAIIDNFTKEELEQIVQESTSYREVILKLGYSTPNGNNNKTLKDRLQLYGISTEHFLSNRKKSIVRTKENVFCQDSTATQATLRRWFILEECVPYRCAQCGISEWQGKKLVLQLDHINGNNRDNRLKNLRWLCPNCHSQTNTFCGKQIKKIKKIKKIERKNYCVDCGEQISPSATRCLKCSKIAMRTIERPSKEELYNFLVEHKGNFSAAGRKYGTSDNNVRKWCDSYGLPRKTGDYKNNKL